MTGFTRTEHGVEAQFEVMEVELLLSLATQLVEMLTEDESFGSAPPVAPGRRDDSGAGDPFARWEAEFGTPPRAEVNHEDADPVVRRLFPDAYPHDPEASSEFRRFTQANQRDAKLAALSVVIDDLEGAGPSGRFGLADDRLNAWLTSLNNLRLSISVRLGITDEHSYDEARERPEHDPRSFLFAIFGWLGLVLQDLVEAINPELADFGDVPGDDR